MALPQRRLPVGAEILPSGEAHFRVWAPRRRAVEVALEGGGRTSLSSEGNGYFSGTVREARTGGRTDVAAIRSVVGTIDLPSDDPDLAGADAYVRGLFDQSLGRPMQVRERPPARKGKRRG